MEYSKTGLPIPCTGGCWDSVMVNSSFNDSLNNFTTSLLGNNINDTTIVHTEDSNFFNKLIIALLAIILIIGSIGNTVVCYVFGFKQRKRRSVPETLFFYLGTVDLIASIINPSLYIYWTATGHSRWDFGIVGCKLLVPLAPMSVTLSAFLILIIAVDRYFIIVHEFGRNYSKSKVSIAAFSALVVSICLYIPYILHLKVKGNSCLVPETADPTYSYPIAAVLLLQDAGFILVLCFTNIRIDRSLRQEKHSNFERAFIARRRRSNARLARILIAMSLVFCLLVLPRDILQLVFIFSWMKPPGVERTPFVLRCNSLLKVLQTANSCVNVFIYSKMHTKFRGHLVRLAYVLAGKRFLTGSEYQSNGTPITGWRMRLLKLQEGDDTPTSSPLLLARRTASPKSMNGQNSQGNGSSSPATFLNDHNKTRLLDTQH